MEQKLKEKLMTVEQYYEVRYAVARAMGAATNYPDGLPTDDLMRLLDKAMKEITEVLGEVDSTLPF